MEACGHITKEQFYSMISDLVKRSDAVFDGWKINEKHDKKYVCKKVALNQSRTHTSALDGECVLDMDDHVDPDSSTLTESEQVNILTYDFHIVYSESYSVPVLYFNVYTDSGMLLSVDAVWNLVPEFYRARLAEDRWSFITQVEHPLLGRPFYQLHPCHTGKLMSSFTAKIDVGSESSSSYLITWLSVVGPVVNLRVPLEFGIG